MYVFASALLTSHIHAEAALCWVVLFQWSGCWHGTSSSWITSQNGMICAAEVGTQRVMRALAPLLDGSDVLSQDRT